MRWPLHPCFLLLSSNTNNNNQIPKRRGGAHNRQYQTRIYSWTTPLSRIQIMDQRRQSPSSMMDISVPDADVAAAVAAAVAKAEKSLLGNKEAELANIMEVDDDAVAIVNVAANNAKKMLKMADNIMVNDDAGSIPGTDSLVEKEPNNGGITVGGYQQEQAMDISLPGDNDGPVMKSDDLQSPLKSVEEETPMIHEHHHSLSNQSGDTNDDDVEMSPSKSSLIGPCRSIEEASVNTTVTMEDADRIIDSPNQTTDTAAAAVMDASHTQDDVMPAVSSGTAEPTDTATGAEAHIPPSHHHNVKLRLTPEEERLFQLLTNAAEAYEAGQLTIDPNPPQQSVSARGGFTKQESKSEDASWLKPPPKVERIEIRVAGGWVRDKLLEQPSVDVDVALDCMMGVQFARIVQSYLVFLQEKEEEGRQQEHPMMEEGEFVNGDSELFNSAESKSSFNKNKNKNATQPKQKKQKSKQPKIGVIGANPSQSKHLETATMNIHGIDIDFVNLRAEEVYESNSRIPTSETRMFGSPLEDALRRDFTINSLFYNVRTHKIEDWTGRGLDDLLVHRRIVTPVDAHVTFHDDPLRVLRAVRFCRRLDFTLDDQIKEAAMSKRVHHSLHVKVSRERVGKELEGMLTGKHARPGKALDMIAELHLAGPVFAFPGSFPGDHDYVGGPVSGHILGVEYNCSLGAENNIPEAMEVAARHRARGWEESTALLALLPTIMEGHADERAKVLHEKIDATALPTTVNLRLLHLCVFILPFHNLTFPDKKGRVVPVTAQMIKEALKFPVRDIQAVSKILSHVDEMTTILSEVRSQLVTAGQQHQTLEEERGDGGGSPSLQLLTPSFRLRAGLLLRSLKEHWVTCLLTAAAWEIRSDERLHEKEDPQLTTTTTTTASATTVPAEQPSRELYRTIVDNLDLDECWHIRPHLDGKEIIKELDLPKGPVVGVYLGDQTQWMLLHPEGTKEQCTLHLHERKREREQEEQEMVINDQNEVNVGVANGAGHSSSIVAEGENRAKHLSKKFRAEK